MPTPQIHLKYIQFVFAAHLAEHTYVAQLFERIRIISKTITKSHKGV